MQFKNLLLSSRGGLECKGIKLAFSWSLHLLHWVDRIPSKYGVYNTCLRCLLLTIMVIAKAPHLIASDSNLSNVWPRSAQLISRAASSVGLMYRCSGPNKGSNSGEGRIKKILSFFGLLSQITLEGWRYVE